MKIITETPKFTFTEVDMYDDQQALPLTPEQFNLLEQHVTLLRKYLYSINGAIESIVFVKYE